MAKTTTKSTMHSEAGTVADSDDIPDKEEREKLFGSLSEAANCEFVEAMILKVLSCKGISKHVASIDILRLLYLSKKLFAHQGRMIEIDGPVRVCGDTHGQFCDLIRLFEKSGFPPSSNYLFLGDYVDRGKNSLEIIILCLSYKVRYPKNFFMLRGNHECAHINSIYGFREEIISRKPNHCDTLYEEFTSTMEMMPLSGLIGRRILCMHGGLSKHLTCLDDLRNVEAPTSANAEGLEMDLLWSDPMSNQTGFKPSPRGASVSFGEDVVHQACKDLDIDLIVRAHQVVQDGYEFFASRRLVTIFSAPNYCGQFDNSAAICVISEGLEVSFEVLKPELMDLGETSECRKSTVTSECSNYGM